MTNVPTLIAPMNAGRCRAFRARFASQACREMARLRSDGGRLGWVARETAGTNSQNAKGGRECARPLSCCRTYWTVTDPFMFVARCGVQMYSYFPEGTLAKETSYFSFGFKSMGLERSEI